MMFFDAAIRFGALSLLLAVAAIILTAKQPVAWRWPLRIAAFHCLSLTGPMVLGAPEPLRAPEPIFHLAMLVAAPNTSLIWLLGLAVFRDRFVPHAGHIAVVSLLTIVSVTVRLPELRELLPYASVRQDVMGLASVILAAHVAAVIFFEGRDDLVEGRRRARLIIVGTLMVGGLTSLWMESLLPEAAKNTFQAGLSLVFVGVLGGWVLTLDGKRLSFEGPRPQPSDQADSDPIYARLIALMIDERPYLEPGLTIGAMANKLSVPEHQLRAVINQRARHRNFSAFINGFRLLEAKKRLADPAEASVPILTIALDAGFGSIASFNRAFAKEEDCTPSVYRKDRLGAPS